MFTVKRKNTNVKNKAYKYRAYPNKQQATLMLKTIGCSRFIYNKLLSDMSSYYKENKETLKREVSFYKSIEEYSFLKEVDSLALANAKLNLNRAKDKKDIKLLKEYIDE